jgi:tRNA pseudouridine13 synthase
MQLRPGSAFFHVEELPAYDPIGTGEHVYFHIEKEGLNTDQVAEALAKRFAQRADAVGYAGRKDRHGVTSQWFSLCLREEPDVAALNEHLASTFKYGRAVITRATRHSNKLRLGHLKGNRFRLGIDGVDADKRAQLTTALAGLTHNGIFSRFGSQRFGINGANLNIARAWGVGDWETAAAWMVDPHGTWRWGDAIPEGFRPGAEGRVLGALRSGASAAKALKSTGDTMRKLVASAAQSAIFNAILDARERLGLVHVLRAGDVGCNTLGAPFLLLSEDVETTNQRALPGILDARSTAPLPGTSRLRPSPEVEAEERQWAAADSRSAGIDWAWFAEEGRLESPGERRPLLHRFLEPAALIPDPTDPSLTWVTFALPSGVYATEVLSQVDVATPEDRSGR